MHFWLLKTEPSCWSWEQQITQNTTCWDGVRNPAAQKYMRSMVCGDLAFFYHTGGDKHIRGIVKIIKEAYPDHTDKKEKNIMVDVQTVIPCQNWTSLADIKAHPDLQHLAIVRQSRLSVCPIDQPSWDLMCVMCKVSL